MIDVRLIARIQSLEDRRDLLINIRNRFFQAFAAEAVLVPVAQFQCFMFARTRSAGNSCSSERAAFNTDVNLDGWVTPRIKDFAGVNVSNAGGRHTFAPTRTGFVVRGKFPRRLSC